MDSDDEFEDNSVEGLRVLIRVRPPNHNEATAQSEQVIQLEGNCSVRIESDVEDRPHKFQCKYDRVLGQEASQQDVFEFIRPTVEKVLQGFNACIFAYGQTGAGKTHTMLGPGGGVASGGVRGEQSGLIPRAVGHLFSCITGWKKQLSEDEEGDGLEGEEALLPGQFARAVEANVHCSYLQIYNEQLHDLLQTRMGGDSLKLRESKGRKGTKQVYVAGLSEFRVGGTDDVLSLLSQGTSNRSIRATEYNESSSRSHAILQISVEVEERGPEGLVTIKKGKLSLVDLAGSEKMSMGTHLTKAHIKELTSINSSLSALGNVMHALCDKKRTHVPYRDSKLTRLLQDSLGGNTMTTVIACISPCLSQLEETISTLYFASRAKQVITRVRRNQVVDDKELLRRARREIKRLKEQVKVLMAQNEASAQEGTEVRTSAPPDSSIDHQSPRPVPPQEKTAQAPAALPQLPAAVPLLPSTEKDAAFKKLKVQLSRMIEENASLKEENQKLQRELNLVRASLQRHQKQSRRRMKAKGENQNSGYATVTTDNEEPVKRKEETNSGTTGLLPKMKHQADQRWDRLNGVIFDENAIEESAEGLNISLLDEVAEEDVEITHLRAAAAAGRSYHAQESALAQAHAQCAVKIEQERERMTAAQKERLLLQEQLAALLSQEDFDEEMLDVAQATPKGTFEEINGSVEMERPKQAAKLGHNDSMPRLTHADAKENGVSQRATVKNGWVRGSPLTQQKERTPLANLLPAASLPGQVVLSPRIGVQRKRKGPKKRQSQTAVARSSPSPFAPAEAKSQGAKPVALGYSNEDLGMILSLYSFRYDQWDECTIVGVDPRKKLHCCHYSEEGTKHWHDLKTKKYKIVGFNGQIRVVESAPAESNDFHKMLRVQQQKNTKGSESNAKQMPNISNRLIDMTLQYSGVQNYYNR